MDRRYASARRERQCELGDRRLHHLVRHRGQLDYSSSFRAVLLDNFVNETLREKEMEQEQHAEHMRCKDNMGNVLDPLLRSLADRSIDQDHLNVLLRDLFKEMSKNAGRGELSKTSVCSAFRALNFEPKIFFSEIDFDSITQNGMTYTYTWTRAPIYVSRTRAHTPTHPYTYIHAYVCVCVCVCMCVCMCACVCDVCV